MSSKIMVADDSGALAQELKAIFKGKQHKISVVENLESCVEAARTGPPAILVVYAGMSRAFSLMRLLRRSDDLAKIPLVVVGDAEQEELIAKHRKLPSRADRYLLRPLDAELCRSVVKDLLGMEEVPQAELPPPLPPASMDNLPPAYQKMQEELHRFQGRVKELERDLGISLKASKEASKLRQENEALRQKLQELPEGPDAGEDQLELFARLETGYKDTIADMERLVVEKDDTIARLAAMDDSGGEEHRQLSERLEQQQAQHGILIKGLRKLSALCTRLADAEAQLDLSASLERVKAQQDMAEELSASFTYDEETVVVEADLLRSQLDRL